MKIKRRHKMLKMKLKTIWVPSGYWDSSPTDNWQNDQQMNLLKEIRGYKRKVKEKPVEDVSMFYWVLSAFIKL